MFANPTVTNVNSVWFEFFCKTYTKFTKYELRQLYLYLRIPDKFVVRERYSFTGEETLLIFLHELVELLKRGEAWSFYLENTCIIGVMCLET